MKVLKEFTKEGKALSPPRRPMRNPVASGGTVSQSAAVNDGTESKSPTEGQDSNEKVSISRQQSMRVLPLSVIRYTDRCLEGISPPSNQWKSRTSGELEREVALSAFQPSAKLSTSTPLNPVTPLRWKSSKRLESEKRKLQDETKTKEVVKEDKKNSKAATEERKDQSKITTTSKVQANDIETSHKTNKYFAKPATSQENSRTNTSSASTSDSTGLTSVSENATDMKHPVTNGGSNEQGKHCEEVPPLTAKHGTEPTAGDSLGTDRQPLTGEESSVITIDFLRARLLAERASSKAAKERIQQLIKKVHDLEGRLDEEIQSKKKAEEAAQEALSKYESIGLIKEKEILLLNVNTKNDQEDQVSLDQAEVKCLVPADLVGKRSDAAVVIEPGQTKATTLEINDDNEVVAKEVKVIPTSKRESSGHHGVKTSNDIGLQDAKHAEIPTVPSFASTSDDSISSVGPEHTRQERRFSKEERLQYMWNQMAEEMVALTEDQTKEDRIREELLNWMRQVSDVLHNIYPKPSEEKNFGTQSKIQTMQLNNGDDQPASLDSDQALNKESVGERSLDGPSCDDKRKVHDEGLKKVASLIERFEAQESIQREWEQSNARQNSVGRKRSNEGSPNRTNSNPGTPSSDQPHEGRKREESADVPSKPLSQVEDPRCNSQVMDASDSPREDLSTETLHIGPKEMDIHVPDDYIPSTCPDPPIVEEMIRRSGGGGMTPSKTHETEVPILEHAGFGIEGTMDPSYITPRALYRASSRHGAGENRGDIRISPVERSQLIKQSNQYSDSRALEGNFKSRGCRSEISGDIGDSARSQALIGWVNLEDAHTSAALANRGDSSLQWDATTKGRHLQHERLGPYSQAGNSNAYIRQEVPGSYPLRNDEREIYRGRMESVSRSMEGLGGSWRYLSDPEGDEIQLYADIPDSIDSATTRRSSPQFPYQVNGSSGYSNYYQAENNLEGTSQSFAYPGRELSRESFQSRSPTTKVESTTSKVNEVLQALYVAKLSIQNTGGRRTSISNPCYPAMEHSRPGGEKHNLGGDYGFYDGQMPSECPAAIRLWSHPEITRRYSTGNYRDVGSPHHLQPSNSSTSFGMNHEARRKYPEQDQYSAGRSSPIRRNLGDRLSTGGGLPCFYPK